MGWKFCGSFPEEKKKKVQNLEGKRWETTHIHTQAL